MRENYQCAHRERSRPSPLHLYSDHVGGYGRQLVFVILCGVVAAVLMAIESVIWWICVAGNYEFGFRSETALIIVSAVSVVSLGIYFPTAIRRGRRKQAGAPPNVA